MEWIATCPHESVDVLALELNALGITTLHKLYRGVSFEADLELAYKAHLKLHSASRIQRVVARFPLLQLNELDSALKKIYWNQWLRSQRPFKVTITFTDREPLVFTEEELVGKIKESIQKTEFEKGAPLYNADSENSINIILFLREGNAVLGIDTAGRALHKRGWRTNGHPAVLKETLAATILLMAGYNGNEVLLDPMCGSGTNIIEAAYIALDKAPLIHRGKDDFALEHLAGFDRPLWRKVSDQLRAQKRNETAYPLFASDINANFVEVARSSALRARVEKYIQFKTGSFQELEPPAQSGLVIMNLPYGERIGVGIIQKLYKEVGDTLRKKYTGWRIAVLVPTQAPIHLLQLKPSRSFDLFNGAIPVKLLVVD